MAAPAMAMAPEGPAAMVVQESERMSRDTATAMGVAAERAAVRVAAAPTARSHDGAWADCRAGSRVGRDEAGWSPRLFKQAAPARRVIRDATVGIVVEDVDGGRCGSCRRWWMGFRRAFVDVCGRKG